VLGRIRGERAWAKRGDHAERRVEMPVMNEERCFQLYLETRSRQVKQMDRHSTQFEHYLTVIMAILAITVGVATQLVKDGNVAPVLWMGVCAVFGVNGYLGYVGVKSCDRSYQRFLEEASIAAKLERYFGLSGDRPRGRGLRREVDPFPGDDCLVPDRWRRELVGYRTSEEFKADKMSQGVNEQARRVLRMLTILNGVLGVAAGMMVLGGAWSIVVSEPGSILLVSGVLGGVAGYTTLHWKGRG
jgi:hypothetical protein